MRELPESFAIAGSWGYIGNQLLRAALDLDISEIHVYDPGPRPEGLDPRVIVHEDEVSFYKCGAEMFHLALHPQHRQAATCTLLALGTPPLILCEKPMALSEKPGDCAQIVQAVMEARAVWMYNFLESYDPMTCALIRWLQQFKEISIQDIEMYRGKDRERNTPRNYKPMVSIEYQEAVHCMAFLLCLFGSLEGSLQKILRSRIEIKTLQTQPYSPPNQQAYRREVNGYCRYRMFIGNTAIRGEVNFKDGAETTKRKVIQGTANGQPFEVETNTQEGNRWLKINRTYQGFLPASTYETIIRTLWGWHQNIPREKLMTAGAIYPNPVFAWAAYQLSGALWHSGWRGTTVKLNSFGELLGFNAGYPEASLSLLHYNEQ